MRLTRLLTLAALLTSLATSALAATAPPKPPARPHAVAKVVTPVLPAFAEDTRGGYVMIQGERDTIAIERFRRSPGRIEGLLVYRAAKHRIAYTLDLGADGRVARMHEATHATESGPDLPNLQEAEVLGDDLLGGRALEAEVPELQQQTSPFAALADWHAADGSGAASAQPLPGSL